MKAQLRLTSSSLSRKSRCASTAWWASSSNTLDRDCRNFLLADRATIGNMSTEYGATCGIFPVDKESLTYLRLTGRSEEQIALVEAYCREQGMFHDEKTPEAEYSELLALDLNTVESSLAGPKRPQDRVTLSASRRVIPRRVTFADQAEGFRAGCRAAGGRLRQRAFGQRSQAGGSLGAGRRQPDRGWNRRHSARGARHRQREKVAAPRQRSHRCDYFVHQHFESFGDGRRWAGGQESG